MAKLLNPATGLVEEVADDDVYGKLNREGYVAPVEGGKFQMVDRDGRPFLVDEEDVARVSRLGALPEAPEATHERLMEREYGDAPVTSFIEGAASGLTFGLSDLVLDDEATRERAKRNRVSRGVGEGVGFVGGALLPGAVGGGLFRAGRLAEGALAAGAKSAGGRIAAKAVGGAVEGALFGAGRGISEVALTDDPDMTAEEALSTIGAQALWGAAGGALVEGGLGAAGEGIRAVAPSVSRGAKGLREGASDTWSKMRAPAAAKKLDDARPYLGDEGVDVFKKALSSEGKALRAAAADVDDLARRGAERANSIRASAVELIPMVKAERQAIADDVLARAFPGGNGPKNEIARDRFLRKSPEFKERGGLDLDDEIEGLYLASRTGQSGRGKPFEQSTLKEHLLSPSPRALKSFGEDVASARAAISRVEQRLNRAPSIAPDEALDEVIRFKVAQKSMPKSAPGTFERVLNIGGSRMTDKVLGLAAFGAGGADLGLGAAAWAAAKQVARSSDPTHLVAQLTKLERASKLGRSRVAQGAASFVGKVASGSRRAAVPSAVKLTAPERGETRQSAFNRRAEEVRRVARDPQSSERQIAETALMGYQTSAPKTAAAIAKTAVRGAEYLAKHLPTDPLAGTMAGEMRSVPWQPPEAELSAWNRRYAAIKDPLSLLDDLRDGFVTPEAVDAVREVYPRVFAKMQSEVLASVSELRTSLPYDKRVSMSLVFDVPVDPSVEPSSIASIQTVHAPKEPQQPSAPPSGGKSVFADMNAPPSIGRAGRQ